jgi:hypothetical protein
MRSRGRPGAVAVHSTNPRSSRANLPTRRSASHDKPTRSDAIATVETDRVPRASATFVSDGAGSPEPRVERHRQLALAIRQRIESRLAGRVRDLVVRVEGDTIVLAGRCATYYSKQLAQHAALGVLDGEPLHNTIVVTM